MPLESITDQIGETGGKLQDYLKSTAEYYKLRLFKSSMKFATSLINLLILGSILLLCLAFISVGLALWLGNLTGNIQHGFFIVGGFYCVLFVFVMIFGKDFIIKNMLSKFSELVLEDKNDLNSRALSLNSKHKNE